MCSVWFSQQTAIVSLNSINRLGFVAEMCVSCEVRAGFLYIIYMNFGTERQKVCLISGNDLQG
jgi:hypothetical protein